MWYFPSATAKIGDSFARPSSLNNGRRKCNPEPIASPSGEVCAQVTIDEACSIRAITSSNSGRLTLSVTSLAAIRRSLLNQKLEGIQISSFSAPSVGGTTSEAGNALSLIGGCINFEIKAQELHASSAHAPKASESYP